MAAVTGTLLIAGGAATAGAAAAKAGIFAVIGAGIVKGLKAFFGFFKNNASKIGYGVSVGATALSGSSFETKNKKVQFKPGAPAKVGGYAFTVPSVDVSDKRNSGSKKNYAEVSDKRSSGSKKNPGGAKKSKRRKR